MGGNEHSNQLPKQQKIIAHNKFRNFKFDAQETIIRILIPFQNPDQITDWQKMLNQTKSLDPESLLLEKSHCIKQKGFCGSSGLLEIVYDSYPHVFEEEIENRIINAKHFQEPEMWYLLYIMVSAAMEMNTLEQKIGDVRPHNIFINQAGQIKLANILSWPKQLTNFEKTVFQKEITYLSPEEMENCRLGLTENKKNHIIYQSFSIGLTMLHAGLLQDMSSLYDIKKNLFKTGDLQDKIKVWNQLKIQNQTEEGQIIQESYSYQLKNFICKLCEIKPKNRLTSLQIFKKLYPFVDKIMALQQFDLNDIGERQQNSKDVRNKFIQQPSYQQQSYQQQLHQQQLHQQYNFQKQKPQQYILQQPIIQKRTSITQSPPKRISQHQIHQRFPNQHIVTPVNSTYNDLSSRRISGGDKNTVQNINTNSWNLGTQPQQINRIHQPIIKQNTIIHNQPIIQSKQVYFQNTQINPNQYYLSQNMNTNNGNILKSEQHYNSNSDHIFNNLSKKISTTTSTYTNVATKNLTTNLTNKQDINDNKNKIPTINGSKQVSYQPSTNFETYINKYDGITATTVNQPDNDDSSAGSILKKIDQQLMLSRKQFPPSAQKSI